MKKETKGKENARGKREEKKERVTGTVTIDVNERGCSNGLTAGRVWSAMQTIACIIHHASQLKCSAASIACVLF